MRTFHDILADIDHELAAADTIPTDAPASVAAFLRGLLTRYTPHAHRVERPTVRRRTRQRDPLRAGRPHPHNPARRHRDRGAPRHPVLRRL
jgi:hypothetical protein